jgi:hypothetical protein
MSLLTAPFEIPARVVQRAIDDLNAIATVARELPGRLDELNARADRVQDQLDRALVLGQTIADNSTTMLAMAERIESRGQALVDLGERMIDTGVSLQRAVAIAEPMEGAVERLGRAIDRLPGGRGRPGPDVTSGDAP